MNKYALLSTIIFLIITSFAISIYVTAVVFHDKTALIIGEILPKYALFLMVIIGLFAMILSALMVKTK